MTLLTYVTAGAQNAIPWICNDRTDRFSTFHCNIRALTTTFIKIYYGRRPNAFIKLLEVAKRCCMFFQWGVHWNRGMEAPPTTLSPSGDTEVTFSMDATVRCHGNKRDACELCN
jgi:hypothetical protein